MAQYIEIEEPQFAKWLFGSTTMAWVWLVARVWLGWEWLQAGWGKVFGGNINVFGDDPLALTGDGNCGWVRACGDTGVGDAVAGFSAGAIEGATGPHPSVGFSWYVNFLEYMRDTGHTFFGPLVAIGEVVIGIALILGMFTGIAAFLGAVMNFNFMFSGSAGVNPGMILVSILLIMAWRNAGWIGLDRWLLPRLGVPWSRKERPETVST